MTSNQRTTTSTVDLAGNAVVGAGMLVVFVFAYAKSTAWPSAASLFPRIITVTGATLSVLFLIHLAIRTLNERRSAAPEAEEPAGWVDRDPAAGEEEPGVMSGAEEEDFGLDYAFANATGAQWARALLWLVAYFATLWIAGAVIATVVVSLLYLKLEARLALVPSLVYAGVMYGVMWASQEYFQLALPPGLLGDR